MSVAEVYTHTHARSQPLELIGSCSFRLSIPQTSMSTSVEFYIVPGHAATLNLLGRKTSEMLGVLKVGIGVNICGTSSDTTESADKKAALRAKFP